jgi:hypothetical protein
MTDTTPFPHRLDQFLAQRDKENRLADLFREMFDEDDLSVLYNIVPAGREDTALGILEHALGMAWAASRLRNRVMNGD